MFLFSFPFCYPFIEASEESSREFYMCSVQVISASDVTREKRETDVTQSSRETASR